MILINIVCHFTLFFPPPLIFFFFLETKSSFNDSNITVDPNLVPKNFDRSGVFQIVGVGAGAKIGTAVRYGASVAFQHRFTQKYVCRGRNDELLLTAARPGVPPGVQCWFRPMPRIKLFAEGQIVTVNARVLIESFSPASSPSWISLLRKSNSNGGSSNLGDDVNQVISSSKASAMDDSSDDVDSNAILAVTSTKVTGIQLRMFATHTVGSRGHLLKGGDFVRLFHQEHTALLEVQRYAMRGVYGVCMCSVRCAVHIRVRGCVHIYIWAWYCKQHSSTR